MEFLSQEIWNFHQEKYRILIEKNIEFLSQEMWSFYHQKCRVLKLNFRAILYSIFEPFFTRRNFYPWHQIEEAVAVIPGTNLCCRIFKRCQRYFWRKAQLLSLAPFQQSANYPWHPENRLQSSLAPQHLPTR